MASEIEVPVPHEDPSSTLSEKIAGATHAYSLKHYEEAADLYSEATALQAEQNGEMALENADLLYAYGRCLYHVAVSKSDVLGGKVAGEEKTKKANKRKRPTEGTAASQGAAKEEEGDPIAEAVLEKAVEDKDGVKPPAKEEPAAENQPYFQITGDENWDDSEEEGDDAAEDGKEDADEEEDDFATAYEILDIARVLLARKLEEPDGIAGDTKGKGKAADSAERRKLKERLADTHDLQAEISLENERFNDAITDSRASLTLKGEIYPQESSIIAEAHFKLSLALEFASVTTTKGEDGEAGSDAPAQVDETLRKEAVNHMEAAIESSKLRVQKETVALSTLGDEAAATKKKELAEVKEIIGDMEQRLIDLQNPAVSLNGIIGPAGAPDGSDPLGGVLGSVLGESKAAQKARIEEAVKGANDLTASVRIKKKPKVDNDQAASNGSKRKAEQDQGASDKRAKAEEP